VGEEAAQQIEREGVAVHFAAGDEEFLVVRFNRRRTNLISTGVME
jgi:hypothetical protein